MTLLLKGDTGMYLTHITLYFFLLKGKCFSGSYRETFSFTEIYELWPVDHKFSPLLLISKPTFQPKGKVIRIADMDGF